MTNSEKGRRGVKQGELMLSKPLLELLADPVSPKQMLFLKYDNPDNNNKEPDAKFGPLVRVFYSVHQAFKFGPWREMIGKHRNFEHELWICFFIPGPPNPRMKRSCVNITETDSDEWTATRANQNDRRVWGSAALEGASYRSIFFFFACWYKPDPIPRGELGGPLSGIR